MGRITSSRPVLKVDLDSGQSRRQPDDLAAEEPLEIRVNGTPLSVTMRTPGNDIDLAHGFLLTEGVIGARSDVLEARYCDGAVIDEADGTKRNTYNVLDVALAPEVALPDTALQRNFYTTSSCGVCGKASIESIATQSRFDVKSDPVRVAAENLVAMPAALRAAQRVFQRTGGLHAAGLFTADGELIAVREDVGRHNAVDKVLGQALLQDRLPLQSTVLMVSGRTSFELAQKALMAGVPVLAAVSAPSTLAVEMANTFGMTLIGFLRGNRFNVYAGSHRVQLSDRDAGTGDLRHAVDLQPPRAEGQPL